MSSEISKTKHFHKNQEKQKAFFDVIICYVQQIRKVSQAIDSEALNKDSTLLGLKGGLDMALRIITGTHPSYISKQLATILLKNNCPHNPFACNWENRKLLYVSSEKSHYALWEHTIPIKQFRQDLIQCRTNQEIINTIKEYPGVAWITRKENQSLTKVKCRDERPEGFMKCYENARIELLNEDMFSNLKLKNAPV